MQVSQTLSVTLHDYHPQADDVRDEILAGLRAPHKTLPSKYFYDARGSELFDRICELPEYYPTRTELGIMETHLPEMADALGPRLLLMEPGSGSSLKTRLLLEALHKPVAYVPVDISRSHLVTAADQLNQRYPELEVLPVCADFSQPFDLPRPRRAIGRVAVYFPGSTIGNFEPVAAVRLLKQLRSQAGDDSALLIGVDLRKDIRVLEAAYNDSAGVTAAFNLNILQRINEEMDGDFDLSRFRHHAPLNNRESRIEMHLVSTADQIVHIGSERFSFREGEHVVTEYSYKYTLESFAQLAARAGYRVEQAWLDDRHWFSVQYLTAA
ncbi:MAG TPA: L-histidine N(alpha)-methyltransferase [Gammaproteobacteria bacterium]|nr:L-histidine N(alpha)-methyltransferase [Gammaproteobacteria bacterium]